jgi:rare lipoprotein A
VIVCGACSTRKAAPAATPKAPAKKGTVEKGIASWYGEPYRSLPFDTVVRVTRRDTGQKVEVRINDRGPFIEGRIIDLSFAAARRIGLDRDGIAAVKLEVLGRRAADDKQPKSAPVPAHDRECWWVQVGAFGDVSNAQRAEGKLEEAGEIAVVMESPDGLHRVRVGPVDSTEEAEAVRLRILADWPASTVVACGG